ncbi:MAG: hypothetical protein JXA41_05025 [Deltaproteobacteria bacterium]|nr:hypothetical protein [Deltaproteobacteria bacterium]
MDRETNRPSKATYNHNVIKYPPLKHETGIQFSIDKDKSPKKGQNLKGGDKP